MDALASFQHGYKQGQSQEKWDDRMSKKYEKYADIIDTLVLPCLQI